MRLDQHWRSSELYWQCYSKDRRRRGAWWSSRRDGEEINEEWFVCEAKKVQVEG